MVEKVRFKVGKHYQCRSGGDTQLATLWWNQVDWR